MLLRSHEHYLLLRINTGVQGGRSAGFLVEQADLIGIGRKKLVLRGLTSILILMRFFLRLLTIGHALIWNLIGYLYYLYILCFFLYCTTNAYNECEINIPDASAYFIQL
jgi:Ca2+/Na+ antiporter